MATCGYICPSCDGREIMEDGSPCSWCQHLIVEKVAKGGEISDEEWMQSVHFGDCCSDPKVSSEEKKVSNLHS
jgi:hypothetical protein